MDKKQILKELYMVVATYEISTRANLEIVDYNLSKDEAETLVSDLRLAQAHNEVEEYWLIDDIESKTGLRIVKQGERI